MSIRDDDIANLMQVKASLAAAEVASLRADLTGAHIRLMAVVKAAGGEVRIARHDMEDLNPMSWVLEQHHDIDQDCTIIRLKKRNPNG